MSQTQKVKHCTMPFYEVHRIDKFIETENRTETPGLEGRRNVELLCNGCGVSVSNDKMDSVDGGTTLGMYLMPLNCMCKTG